MAAAVHAAIGEVDATDGGFPTPAGTGCRKEIIQRRHASITLSRRDILRRCGATRLTATCGLVGFAAEATTSPRGRPSYGRRAGLIVANDILSETRACQYEPRRCSTDDTVQELPLMSKADVAQVVIDRLERMLA
jgi:hypothetical protein